MFVKPAPHPDDPEKTRVVRRPDRVLLRAEGEEVGENNFWYRRLRDGDVVLIEPPDEPAPEAARENDTGEAHPELAEAEAQQARPADSDAPHPEVKE